ncbi:MAG: hypothetical protein L0287_07020 [Anaerolineae bacterium]|nr:hypothetical protein [Anaerolineae bacterium]MCI0608020.1 hypothetical protein [Anaerolineae bacterium]
MDIQPHTRFSLAAVFLLIFLLLANAANGLYAGLLIQSSPVFQLASTLAFLWVLGWWIIDDDKIYGLTWVQSYGVFLYIISWIIIPIYLFRTRGSKAFLFLLLFAGIYLATYIFSVMIAVMINVLRNF